MVHGMKYAENIIKLLDTKIEIDWLALHSIEIEDPMVLLDRQTLLASSPIQTKWFKGQVTSRFRFGLLCFPKVCFKSLLLVQSVLDHQSYRLAKIKHIAIKHFIKSETLFLGVYGWPGDGFDLALYKVKIKIGAFICLTICYSLH